MLTNLRQFVPSSACLECDVCCRYPERTTIYTPYFLPKETEGVEDENVFTVVGKRVDLKTSPMPCKDHYICRFFVPDKNVCSIYPSRPIDCRLYPFMVTYDRDFKSIGIALDKKCPYLKNRCDSKEFKGYVDYLGGIFQREDVIDQMNRNKNFISDFQEDFIYLRRLENLSKKFCLSEYGLTRISLEDKGLFDERFSKTNPTLSSFSFAAIYIWSAVLNILWKEIDGALCVFAGGDRDYFLLVPPVDDGVNESAIKESREILNSLNGESPLARTENVPQEFFENLSALKMRLNLVSCEYIYDRKDIAELKGNRFKSKRSSINFFLENYKYTYRPFERIDIFECLGLYRQWATQRLEDIKDDYFRVLIEDSYFAQKKALMNFELLNLRGRVVEVEGEVKGCSLGYPLSQDTFVILFETADLNTKGLSQFIFREFSRDLSDYKYVNALSDSGLENLKKVKDSYHPIKKIPVYTAYF